MIVKDLKETLNGGYGGLYGEVVTEDCYRLRTLAREPDVIFDLGANIGIFARYARELFRSARIVSVEPDEENCIHFRKFTEDANTILIESAIGQGPIWHPLGSANGAMQCYLSEGLGYPREAMEVLQQEGQAEEVRIPTILPAALFPAYWKPGQRALLKMDIEGGENAVFNDPPSMELIRQMDYIAMEVHFYAVNAMDHPDVVRLTMQALESLEETHHCELSNKNFWAVKK